MKLQYLCHVLRIVIVGIATVVVIAPSARGDAPAHDYPTLARVEYVNRCVEKNGNKLAALYQCSCAIDKIAKVLEYDDFVEASTFINGSTIAGEGGGEFRDNERGKKMSKAYRELEAEALHACGMPR